MHSKRTCLGSVGTDSSAANSVARAVTTVTLGVAVALRALGIESFWLAFVFGFGVVLPMATQWADREQEDTDSESDSALERVQQRYASGELSDEEFENRVERLLVAEADAREGRRAEK